MRGWTFYGLVRVPSAFSAFHVKAAPKDFVRERRKTTACKCVVHETCKTHHPNSAFSGRETAFDNASHLRPREGTRGPGERTWAVPCERDAVEECAMCLTFKGV